MSAPLPLSGRSALVTGSTGGLGHAIAAHLVAQGARVMLTGLLPEAEMADEIARLNTGGGAACYQPADISDPAALTALIDAAEERHGAVDILVNNAVVRHTSPIAEYPPEKWELALAVNLSAPFYAIRRVLPGMREKGFGRILNVASVYSFKGIANRVDYVTTKTGLLGLTRTVALEVAADEITCNAVCPGVLPTPAITGKIAGIALEQGVSVEEATRAYLADRHPSGRFASMEAVAALVSFLCSPQARDINGAVLPVDGAWLAS